MRIFRIIIQIGILYSLYVIGCWIQESLNLLIPGSIIGMLLLFGLLFTNVFKIAWIADGADVLVRYLPLLFLPVIVGIIDYFDLFAGKGLLLLGIVAVSTLVVMISSGFVSQLLYNRLEKNNGE